MRHTFDIHPDFERKFWCFFDDDEPSSTAVTQSTSEPWEAQQAPLERGFERAEDIYNTPLEYYPGSTVVPWSPETQEAMQGMADVARGGMPGIQGAIDEARSTIGGDYLLRENPYYSALADRTAGDIQNRVASQFAGNVGAMDSPAYVEAMSRGIGDALAPLQYQAFQQERGNQLALLPQAAQLERMATSPYDVLGGVGGAREQQAGAELQGDIDRWNFEQQEPRRRLQEYLAAVAGGRFGGSTTQTQPVYSSPWATGLGSAATLAGIGGSLFGRGGIWPGSL